MKPLNEDIIAMEDATAHQKSKHVPANFATNLDSQVGEHPPLPPSSTPSPTIERKKKNGGSGRVCKGNRSRERQLCKVRDLQRSRSAPKSELPDSVIGVNIRRRMNDSENNALTRENDQNQRNSRHDRKAQMYFKHQGDDSSTSTIEISSYWGSDDSDDESRLSPLALDFAGRQKYSRDLFEKYPVHDDLRHLDDFEAKGLYEDHHVHTDRNCSCKVCRYLRRKRKFDRGLGKPLLDFRAVDNPTERIKTVVLTPARLDDSTAHSMYLNDGSGKYEEGHGSMFYLFCPWTKGWTQTEKAALRETIFFMTLVFGSIIITFLFRGMMNTVDFHKIYRYFKKEELGQFLLGSNYSKRLSQSISVLISVLACYLLINTAKQDMYIYVWCQVIFLEI